MSWILEIEKIRKLRKQNPYGNASDSRDVRHSKRQSDTFDSRNASLLSFSQTKNYSCSQLRSIKNLSLKIIFVLRPLAIKRNPMSTFEWHSMSKLQKVIWICSTTRSHRFIRSNILEIGELLSFVYSFGNVSTSPSPDKWSSSDMSNLLEHEESKSQSVIQNRAGKCKLLVSFQALASEDQ